MPKPWTNAILACALLLCAVLAFTQSDSRAAKPGQVDAVPAKTDATSVDPKPAPATPIDAKKAELGGKTWNPQWDSFIEQSIPPDMLSSQVPRDVRKFCPNFYGMSDTDKRVFWAYFFQALAGAEAGLNPTTNVRHPQMAKIDQVTAQPVHSEGLLQLTFEDQKVYGCDFDWNTDRKLAKNDPDRTILQPKNNLACGIKILDSQIIEHRRPLLTKKSYWSPLQPGTVPYRIFLKEMVNPPAACAKPARPRHLKDVTTADVHQKAAGAAEEAAAR